MVWHAYADDSGTHDTSEYCLLVGYIGSPLQWKRVRRDWRGVLGDIPEFKATQFFQRERWQSSKSPYHRWGQSEARTFLNRLLSIIDGCAIWPIGGACKTSDFYSYPTADRKWLTGATFLTLTHRYQGKLEITDKLFDHEGSPDRPYFIVFPGLLVDAMRVTSGKQKPRIQFYIDRQGAAESSAEQYFASFKNRIIEPEKANLASLTYAESHDEVGIQAADLYAYTWYRKLTDSMTPDLARAYQVLTKKKADIKVADRDYFDSLLAWGTEHRQAAINNRRTEFDALRFE